MISVTSVNSVIRTVAWSVLLLVASPAYLWAGAQVSPDEVLREREESLAGIRGDYALELVTETRSHCAHGQEPAAIASSRQRFDSYALPDAADSCMAGLERIGREGALLAFYRDLLRTLTGSSDGYEHFPEALAATLMKRNATTVPIGHNRGLSITAALALDAGFTVAYRAAEKWVPSIPTVATLKPIAERCLSLVEPDFGLCYATGYAYGVLAINGKAITAVRVSG